MPTILHLLGISTEGEVMYGKNIFFDKEEKYALIKHQGFVGENYVYARIENGNSIAYDLQTGKLIPVKKNERNR